MSSVGNISCDQLDLALDIDTGTIRSIVSGNHSLMVGRCGYVAAEDRTTGRFHFRPEDRVPAEPVDHNGFAIRQTDRAGDMVMTQRFSAHDKSIEWAVRVTTESRAVREIHLHFVIPVFGAASHGFTANAKCPLVPGDGNDHMMVVYGPNMWNEECFHCSVLPMVSAYDPDADAGLVVIQPVDTPKPRMEYFFVREQPDISLVVRWTHLRLQRDRPVVARMMLAPIRGCWRDALRCVHRHYGDHFRVHEESIFDHEGPMTCGELLPDNTLDKLVNNQHLAWQEIHANVFEYYGNYAPRTDAWPDWVANGLLKDFDLERLSRTEFRDMHIAITSKAGRTITRSGLNGYVDMLARKGVGAYLYTNPVILDLDHVRDFPDSLAKSAEGTPMFHDYYRNAPMYPAGGTTWACYLDDMTDRALDLFPGIDGFFLDELHWNQFDFGHDDGISARGDRAVAMIGFAVQDAAGRICGAAHRRGKSVWANGPATLEVVHYVDGFMAECSWEWLGTVMYLGLEKPVVLAMPSGWGVSEVTDALNAALFAGAQPGVISIGEDNPQNIEHYIELLHRYQPLFKILRGRKWILHPHAITTELCELRANCFVLPEGDFAVTLSRPTGSDYKFVSADGYALEKAKAVSGMKGPVRIRLDWPGVGRASSASLICADGSHKPSDLKIEREDGGIVFSVPPVEAAVVRIEIPR